MSKKKTFLLLLAFKLIKLMVILAFFSSGCGRETKVFPEETSAAVDQQADDFRFLPDGFFDQSGGRASAQLALDANSDTVIRLQTASGADPAGNYNGSGVGHSAILGVSQFNKKKLSEFSSISFDVKNFTGTLLPSVRLVVDLECDGVDLAVLVADSSALPAPVTQNFGYQRYLAEASAIVWKAMDADVVDSTSAVLVSASSPSDLSGLVAGFPNACLVNVPSGKSEMPKDLVTAGVQLVVGDSNTVALHGVYLHRLTFNSDVFEEFK